MSDPTRVRFSFRDSDELAAARRQELDIPRHVAADLGRSAVKIVREGRYRLPDGREISIAQAMNATLASRASIPPDQSLRFKEPFCKTGLDVEVSNETTFGAAGRLVNEGSRPLALNFANGIQTWRWIFERGARAGRGALSIERTVSDA